MTLRSCGGAGFKYDSAFPTASRRIEGNDGQGKGQEFCRRVFADMASTMTAGMGYVGVKTGLFRAMAGKGAMRIEDVVRKSGLTARYVEEWLKGMTCAKYLDYDAAGETYRLPDEHAFLLASDETDHFMGGLFVMAPVLLRDRAPDVATAFARGGGVPFEKFGARRRRRPRPDEPRAIRTAPCRLLAAGAAGGARAGLEAGGRALDVGCGAGRVCVALAKNFPAATIVGSIRTQSRSAKRKHRRRGRRFGRVSFVAASTGDLDAGERFRPGHRLRLH